MPTHGPIDARPYAWPYDAAIVRTQQAGTTVDQRGSRVVTSGEPLCAEALARTTHAKPFWAIRRNTGREGWWTMSEGDRRRPVPP